MTRRLLTLGLVSSSALALCAAAVLVVAALVLRDDVKALEGQARGAARMEETLRADIAAIRRDIGGAAQSSAAQPVATQAAATQSSDAQEPRVAAAFAVSPVAATAPARFIKASSAAPAECAFHPGDPEGLMDCIRRQQESRVPARNEYR